MINLSAPINAWMPIVWYAGYTPNLPDLCVGRWPALLARGRADDYKIWYVENPAERGLLLDALARPAPRVGRALDFSSGPDRATRNPPRAQAFVAMYAPPEPGWPWVIVTSIDGAPASMGLGRGRYAYDVFDTQAAAVSHMTQLWTMIPDAPVYTPADVVKS